MHDDRLERFEVRVRAIDASGVDLVGDDGSASAMREVGGDEWAGHVPRGTRYGLRVRRTADDAADDVVLVDPNATEVWFDDRHTRAGRRPHGDHSGDDRAGGDRAGGDRAGGDRAGGDRAGSDRTGGDGAGATHAFAVALEWPPRRPSRPTARPLVVYETHARGLTKRRAGPEAGTFRAAIDELPRLADLGVSVIELLPVHQYDPDEGNYWGYMPLVFGAVHAAYAAGARPADELADLVGAAHEHDIEVWLDVVFNHTTEEDADGPVFNLRALDERGYYVVTDDGAYVDDAGTGNIVDATSPPVQALVMTALDRFADLGVDGFRFDLASVLARDPGFVRRIGDWSEQRGVRLIAEPWDLARYQLGGDFPDRRWLQWNGRFRDDMRGFLRGEPGLIDAVMRRVAGSPDLFDDPGRSVNFLTSHDGFTMYDLVAHDHKHNEANGWDGADGTDDNRSWNCGWEGDDGVPDEVVELRRRQIRNAFCLLLLSRGTPMFVAGDEFARTQAGNNNPYNQDNEISWIDWSRRGEFAEIEAFVNGMIALRAEHRGLHDPASTGPLRFFGTEGAPDRSGHSRALAWHVPGLDVPGLYVMANMWWESLAFRVEAPGIWRPVVDTAEADGSPRRVADSAPAEDYQLSGGDHIEVAGRSVVVLAAGDA